MATLIDVSVATCGRAQDDEIGSLVRASARGDQDAWNRLVDRYESLVWSVARAHRLNDADAADVVQTTWLRLLEHLPTIREPERVGAWLSTTARRASLRVIGTAKRQVPSDPHDQVGADLVEEEDIDQRIYEADRQRAVWAALERLSPRRRQLLRLLAADPQPTYEEISAAIDIPIGSIGPTRSRALAELRLELAAFLDEAAAVCGG